MLKNENLIIPGMDEKLEILIFFHFFLEIFLKFFYPGFSGSDLYQKKSKKEKPKPKPQPQDFHKLMQRAQQQKNGINFETPNSSSNG